MDIAFKYVKDAGGIDTEASYPYTAKDGNCTYDPKNSGATLTSWVDIPHNSEAVSWSCLGSQLLTSVPRTCRRLLGPLGPSLWQ